MQPLYSTFTDMWCVPLKAAQLGGREQPNNDNTPNC